MELHRRVGRDVGTCRQTARASPRLRQPESSPAQQHPPEAARLQLPPADLDDRPAILPASYGIGAIDRLLDEHDTLVLLKVRPLLDGIIDLLERRRLLEHSVFIEKTGTLEERIVWWICPEPEVHFNTGYHCCPTKRLFLLCNSL